MITEDIYDIFLSHAGQEKRDFVDLLYYHVLKYQWGTTCNLRVFMDEHSLKPGDIKQPWPVIESAARHCNAAVVVVSANFVRKEDPMKELQLLVARRQAEPSFILLPVFYGLSVEDCLQLDTWYQKATWPSELGKQPPASTLGEWAALVKALPLEITGLRLDQNHFSGSLAIRAAAEVIQRLVDVGKLPASLVFTAANAKNAVEATPLEEGKMVLQKPALLFGRQLEIRQVMNGLCGPAGAAVVVGPPGEGKTTVAARAARLLCEKGLFPGGAFQVDLSGFDPTCSRASGKALGQFVEEFFADRLNQSLGQAKGLTRRPTEPSWDETAKWLDCEDMGSVLLVLENTEDVLCDAEAAKELRVLLEDQVQVQKQQQKHGLAKVLVNSRSTPSMRLQGAPVIDLGVLEHKLGEDDALLLLQQHVGCQWRRIGELERRQLVQMCQCNPLSLEITGSFINHGRCTAKVVLQRYTESGALTGIQEANCGELAADELERSRVHIKWLLSMLCAEEQEALGLLSLYPDSFDVDGAAAVITAAPGSQQPECRPAKRSCLRRLLPRFLWQDSKRNVGVLLQRLRHLSVLQQVCDAGPRYRMHMLVKELTGELQWHLWQDRDDVIQQAGRRMVYWMLLDPKGPGQQLVRLARLKDNGACQRIAADEANNFAQAVQLVDEVKAGTTAAGTGVDTLAAGTDVGTTDKLDRAVDEVLELLPQYMKWTPDGAVVTLVQSQQWVVDWLTRVGATHAVTLRARQRLAWLLYQSGVKAANLEQCKEALEMYQQLVGTFADVLGRGHRSTVLCMGGLAHVLQHLGQLQEARQRFLEVLQHFGEGKHHDWVAVVNYYDQKLFEVDSRLHPRPSIWVEDLAAADPLLVRYAQAALLSALEALSGAKVAAGDGGQDVAEPRAGGMPSVPEAEAAAASKQLAPEDPREAEMLATWAVELTRDEKLEGAMKVMQAQREKMANRYTEGLLLPPGKVSEEERQELFDALQHCLPLWRRITDALERGGISRNIFHHHKHWAERAMEFRELAEPVEIALWYFQNKHVELAAQHNCEDTGYHYSEGIQYGRDENGVRNGRRPEVYILLQGLEAEVLPDEEREEPMVSTVEVARRFAEQLGTQTWQDNLQQLQRTMSLLVHACSCNSNTCGSTSCRKVRSLFQHAAACQLKVAGGCHLCCRLWGLLNLHAKNCSRANCAVPRCKELKEMRHRQILQQDQHRGTYHDHIASLQVALQQATET